MKRPRPWPPRPAAAAASAALLVLAAVAPYAEASAVHLRSQSRSEPLAPPLQPPPPHGEAPPPTPEEKLRAAAREAADAAAAQAKNTLEAVKKTDLTEMIKSDFDQMVRYFLPGYRWKPDIFHETSAIALCGALWMAFWVSRIYQSDRSTSLDRWGAEVAAMQAKHPTGSAEIKPDLIIVFHHPDFERKDQHRRLPTSALQHLLVADVDMWRVTVGPDEELEVKRTPSHHAERIGSKRAGDFVRGHLEDNWVALADEQGFVPLATKGPEERRLLELVGAHPSRVFHRLRLMMKVGRDCDSSGSPTLKRLRQATTQTLHTLAHRSASFEWHEEEEHLSPPSYAEARVALLQDLYAALPLLGFDAAVFSSIDDDELYVCISLNSEDAISSYLTRHSTLLQIRHEVVKQLGVRQPPEEVASSPPLMTYDPRIVEKLHAAGVLPSDDPRTLYRTYHGRSTKGCIVSGKERFKMVFQELCTQLDLDAASHEGLIVDWYPAHSELWLLQLTATWASFRHLLDLSFVQPISLIYDYFGARVAFIFAWNGLYCKALLALALVAVLLEAGIFALSTAFGSERVHKRVVMGFGVVNILWARVACNLWDREQEFFLKAWELNPEAQDQVRPSFVGERQPCPADYNIMEKQYPASKQASRKFLSTLVTLVFCTLVAVCIVVWTNIFQGHMDFVASICLAVQIGIFQAIYNAMLPQLTDWENHKFQSHYYDSYLLKQFMFQSVNSYSAFFYLAMKQRYTKAGCPPGGCLAVLRLQLTLTLLMLTAARVAQVVLQSLMVQLKIWLEDRGLRQRARKASSGSGEAGEADSRLWDERSYIELQSKFASARLQEQIDMMQQLMLGLGFVLLFGCVAPIIVPFCLVVFVVQLRSSAYMLLHYTKRTVPRQQIGIGRWRAVLSALMQLSILLSGFLVAVFSDIFVGTPLLAKLAGFICYVILMHVLCAVVDIFVPKTCPETALLRARRQRVQSVIMSRSQAYGVEAGTPTSGQQCRAHLAEEVETGSWEKIPHLQSAAYLHS